MNLYAYIPDENGKEPLGTDNRMIIRDLKTIRGAVRRIMSYPRWKEKGFVLQTYRSFYEPETFKTVHQHIPA